MQSHQLQPGGRVNLVSHQQAAIRIRVVTLCGAEIMSALHPGAGWDMAMGTSSIRIEILDAGKVTTDCE
jgi:hypothetical protein